MTQELLERNRPEEIMAPTTQKIRPAFHLAHPYPAASTAAAMPHLLRARLFKLLMPFGGAVRDRSLQSGHLVRAPQPQGPK
jgi:hypothetical protein